MDRIYKHIACTRSAVSLSFAILLIGTALAGCVGTQDTSADPIGLEEPWPVGSWWTYRMNGSLPADWMDVDFGDDTEGFGHEPKFSIEFEATLVATMDREAGDDPRFVQTWPREVLSDDRELSFLQRLGVPLADRWTVNSEEIRTGNGTTFFDMPLEDGKKWTMDFMGISLQIGVDRSGDTVELAGVDENGLPLLRYTYHPETAWFGEFRILNIDGSEAFTALLEGHGRQYSGTLYWLQLVRIAQCVGGSEIIGPGSCGTGMNVHEGGDYSSWIDIAYRGEGPGHIAATKSTPNDVLAPWFEDTCPCEDEWSIIEDTEEAGDYEWTISHGFTGEWILSFLNINRCFVTIQANNGWTDQHPAHTGQCLDNSG